MQITLAFDTTRLRQDLAREQQRIVRAARRTVNHAAISARNEIVAAMATTFDRPTPYVRNGTEVMLATDASLEAVIDWRQGGGNKSTGPGAGRVLRAQIEGGQRDAKRFERLFALRPGYSVVPGKWAEMDAYGNIRTGQLIEILSALRLFNEQGFTANRPRRLRNRRVGRRGGQQYFIRPLGATKESHPQTWHLPPGVYRVARDMGGAPLLVLAFVRAARYAPRFAPARIARDHVARNITAWWQQALSGQLPNLSLRTPR